VHAAQVLQHRDQPGVQHRLDRAHAQQVHARLLGAQLVAQLAVDRHQPLGVVEEAHAGVGQRELLAIAAVDQQDAQLLLQRRDAARDGRLRHEQLLRSPGHALEGRDPVERFDKPLVHGASGGVRTGGRESSRARL
jgi:hypothetical protein